MAGLLIVVWTGARAALRHQDGSRRGAPAGALEWLFLVRRLPAWHTSDARRLVKTPKIHLVDSGIASTLAGLVEADWLTNVDRLGHLLESFVVQQLMAQAGWTDPDLRFWHYRDKDQVEVDLVITRGAGDVGGRSEGRSDPRALRRSGPAALGRAVRTPLQRRNDPARGDEHLADCQWPRAGRAAVGVVDAMRG